MGAGYAEWIGANWVTMRYPERYDCDLPIVYMVKYAEARGIALEWIWPNYFPTPQRSRVTGRVSRDVILRTDEFLYYGYDLDSFAWAARQYFGISHFPVLVEQTGGRILPGSAPEILRGESHDSLRPGDIFSSGFHALTWLRPYRDAEDFARDYQRVPRLRQWVRRLRERASRLGEDDGAGVADLASETEALTERLAWAQAAMLEHAPGNEWDPAVQRALAEGQVPQFVPGQMVDSIGRDILGDDPSQEFAGFIYPDLSLTNPLPHIVSGSAKTMWEWFAASSDAEGGGWQEATIVLRPFED